MKSSMARFVFALFGGIVISGCGGGAPSRPPLIELAPVTSEHRDKNGKFTLVISNGCTSRQWIDAKVEIDDEVVVHELFHIGVGDRFQHTDKRFKLALTPGEYRLRLSSLLNKTELHQTFRVDATTWGAYLSIGCPPANPEADAFVFSILDREFLWK